MSVECIDRYPQLARNFALTAEVDALTAEVAGAFGREGIETLMLKGPVLAKTQRPIPWSSPDFAPVRVPES